ncbi:twin-arginine translocase subunit TatC [Pseudokineococcus basanitobsidens]|uniref:Sec-independent protein translocase protein TatC n=1 Tax=Pseudokineococcus basanitobsidens TaxID=1926649 RepID=A0ABU8RIY0_9ACTN
MALRTPSRRRRDPEGRMPLGSHLRELRDRVVKAAVAVLLGAVAGWFLKDPVLAALAAPLEEAASEAGRAGEVTLNLGNLTGILDLQIKVSIVLGIIASSPVWLYQLWAFITPGLTRREKRTTVAFVGTAVPLFLAGSGLAFLVLPNAVSFFVDLTPQGFVNVIDASTYIGFFLRIIVAFGLAFVTPVVLVGVNFVGLLPARTMLRAWRWVIVLCFAFAAVATPTPDALTMFLLALPMCGLFFAAIGIAALNDRRRARRDRDEGYGGLSDDEVSPL